MSTATHINDLKEEREREGRDHEHPLCIKSGSVGRMADDMSETELGAQPGVQDSVAGSCPF